MNDQTNNNQNNGSVPMPPPPPPPMQDSSNQNQAAPASFVPPPPPPPPPPPAAQAQDNQQQTNSAAPSTEEINPIGNFGRSNDFHSSIQIPAHQLSFDEQHFLRLLAGSISLSRVEKKRIIESIPKLSQYQIDELINIFEEEKKKFAALDVKHQEQLKALEAKHSQEWEALEMEYEQGEQQEEESAAVEDIKKSLGI